MRCKKKSSECYCRQPCDIEELINSFRQDYSRSKVPELSWGGYMHWQTNVFLLSFFYLYLILSYQFLLLDCKEWWADFFLPPKAFLFMECSEIIKPISADKILMCQWEADPAFKNKAGFFSWFWAGKNRQGNFRSNERCHRDNIFLLDYYWFQVPILLSLEKVIM